MTVPLTPAQQAVAVVRLLVVGLVLAAVGFAGWKVWDWRERAIAGEAQVTSLEGTAAATSGATDAVGTAQADAQRVEIVVTQTRADALRAIEELTHADPTVAELRARPIPDGLRDIARERRQARERGAADRPQGAGAGRPGTD